MPSCEFMIRGHGDLKIEWTEANHAEAVKLIQAKMDAGVTFFILDPASKAKNPPVVPLTQADQATAHRVYVRDHDIKAFIEAGFGTIASFAGTPEMKEKVTKGRTESAAEAAKTDTVAVQPGVGG